MNETFDPTGPTLMFEFENVDAAKHFKEWLCESGEQKYWMWMEDRESEEHGDITGIEFDYHKDTRVPVACGRMDEGAE